MTQKEKKGLNLKLKKLLCNGNQNKKSLGLLLGIIHIFAIESHDIIKHTLGLDSRTVGVKLYSLDVAVNGLMPFGFFTIGVSLFVPFLCCHSTYLFVVFFFACC